MSSKNYTIYGVSKGLGKAIVQQLPNSTDKVYGVSRSKPDYIKTQPNLHWIAADLAHPTEAISTIKNSINEDPIDVLIYNVGIWEHNAFDENYRFADNSALEITAMINTNITSCILAIQALIDNLKRSPNAKIILIGSTWGLDNHNGREVTFSASKFALRGITHALRENLRADHIGVSVLNLGYLATEFEDITDVDLIIKATQGQLIPIPDVLNAIRFIISTSKATCVKEINMPAMADTNV